MWNSVLHFDYLCAYVLPLYNKEVDRAEEDQREQREEAGEDVVDHSRTVLPVHICYFEPSRVLVSRRIRLLGKWRSQQTVFTVFGHLSSLQSVQQTGQTADVAGGLAGGLPVEDDDHEALEDDERSGENEEEVQVVRQPAPAYRFWQQLREERLQEEEAEQNGHLRCIFYFSDILNFLPKILSWNQFILIYQIS